MIYNRYIDGAQIIGINHDLFGFMPIHSKNRKTQRMGCFYKVNPLGSGSLLLNEEKRREEEMFIWNEQLVRFDSPYNYHRFREEVKSKFWKHWSQICSLSSSGESYISAYMYRSTQKGETSDYLLVKIHSKDLILDKKKDIDQPIIICWHETPGQYKDYYCVGKMEDFVSIQYNVGSIMHKQYESVDSILMRMDDYEISVKPDKKHLSIVDGEELM